MQTLHFPPDAWQASLRDSVTEPEELLKLLTLPEALLPAAEKAARLFPLRVPREFIKLMKPADPNDPLLNQVLPLAAETILKEGYSEDPLQEANARPAPGVIHKYKDRVLLILSGACAINCRYCFRRHFPYADNQLSGPARAQALAYIRDNRAINEVILSGGDPLVTPDTRLCSLIEELEQIDHLQRLRIHSRLPVVIPSRITETLIRILSSSRLKPVLVLHINHPDEISQQLVDACSLLKSNGVTLLNQAVLLKGINDSADIQVRLSRRLFAAGILPYYLFLFDPVQGASHFDLPEHRAREIAAEMQSELPGYLVPRLAKEIPGRCSKTLITPDSIKAGEL